MATVFLLPQYATAANIGFVLVEHAFNDSDPETGRGGVDYDYKIAKHETTINQYVEFLNAVAHQDPYRLYHTKMEGDLNTAGIVRYIDEDSGNYVYSVFGMSGNRPITHVR